MALVHSDLANEYQSGISVAPQNYVADFNGSSVDFRDCEEHITVVIAAGMLEGSDTTVTVELEESDDDSTWTDISGAASSALSADHTATVLTLSGRAKRYVRAVANLAGASMDANVSVVLMSKKKSY